MQNELFDIPGYEGKYAITKDGKIWSYPKPIIGYHKGKCFTKGKFLKPKKDTHGYLRVKFGSKGKFRLVHRILAEIFLPKINIKKDVNHINGKRDDNRLKNLEWATRSENIKHGYNIGSHKPNKKLNEIEVNKIRELRESGFTYDKISMIYKVSSTTILRVIKKIGYS